MMMTHGKQASSYLDRSAGHTHDDHDPETPCPKGATALVTSFTAF